MRTFHPFYLTVLFRVSYKKCKQRKAEQYIILAEYVRTGNLKDQSWLLQV